MHTQRTKIAPDLEATIYSHDLDVSSAIRPAWTLVTEGLSRHRQREVALTILRSASLHGNFPEGVLNYVATLGQFASQGQGQPFGDGSVCEYRASGSFRLGSFVGLAFMDAPVISGIALPGGTLAGVLLTEGELSMAMGCSPRRVLNRLGKAAHYFPTPYWSDPRRRPVYVLRDAEKSLLSKFQRASVPEGYATLRGDIMDLSVPSHFAADLSQRMERRMPSAILPGREPGVPAALVWSPGQLEPEAIFAYGREPSSIAATFVALVPNDAEQDDIRFMEDGYVIMLSTLSAERLATALRKAEPTELRGQDQGRSLRITVRRTR